MNPHTRILTSFVLIAVASALALSALSPAQASSQGKKPEKRWAVKDSKIKSGPEAAARVRSLKEHSKDVRAAFKAFEKRGRTPRMDDAALINGTFEPLSAAGTPAPRGMSLFLKAGFTQEQSSVSGGGYELILVPTIVADGEWQGTAIATKFDDYGYVVDQYTSNIVTVADSAGETQMVYEVRYDSGIPYLQHQPGMYTGFALGLTIQEHETLFGAPPPLGIESWQFPSHEIEQQYYQQYPEQQQFQQGMLQQGGQVSQLRGALYSPASFRGGAMFRRAGFQARSDRSAERYQLRRFCGNPNGCGPGMGAMFSGDVNRWLVQSTARCAGGALACRGNAQCTMLACAGAAISALPSLYGWQ